MFYNLVFIKTYISDDDIINRIPTGGMLYGSKYKI